MLGYHISVYRQRDDGSSPAAAESQHGTRIAVWQTSSYGLEWLDALAKQGHAINLGGDGYPCRYTSQAKHLNSQLAAGPPDANSTWSSGAHDIIGPGWVGQTAVDGAALADCRPDEWLLVEAWDES